MNVQRGSGGGPSLNGGTVGGNGGGAFILEGTSIDINGTITVNGANGVSSGSQSGSGGGAGGGILLKGKRVTLDGTLSAVGGNGGDAVVYYGGGGGAGGRLKVFASAYYSYTGNASVYGGARGNGCCTPAEPGGDGTFHDSTFTGSFATYQFNPLISLQSSNSNDTICPGKQVTFTAAGYSYDQYKFLVNDSVVQDSTVTEFVTSSLQNGDSIQVVGVIAGGCTDTSLPIRISVLPNIQTVSNFSYDNSNGLLLTFTDSSENATNYIWQFGDGDTSHRAAPSHLYDSIGTYQVCQQTYSACGTDTLCDSVKVCNEVVSSFTYTREELTVDFNNTSNDYASLIWDFGDTTISSVENPTYTFDSSGTYQVCLYTQNSCGRDTLCQMVTVQCPLPTLSFSYSYDSTDSTMITFTSDTTNADSLLWQLGDGNTSNQPQVTHNYADSNETYLVFVCLTGYNHCGQTDTCQAVKITSQPDDTSNNIRESVHTPTIRIYPNPADQILSIDLTHLHSKVRSVQLFNVHGQRIIRTAIVSSSKTQQMDLSHLPEGIYFIQIKTEAQILTKKLLIQRNPK